MKSKCQCGKVKSKYAAECRTCYKVRKEGWEADRCAANEVLKKTPIILNTAFGAFVIKLFTVSLEAICYPVDKPTNDFYRRTFHLHGGHVQMVLNGEKIIN